MQYRIETLDGYKFHYEATENSCIDLVNADAIDFVFENESELLTWVSDNIENIGLFARHGIDPVVGI